MRKKREQKSNPSTPETARRSRRPSRVNPKIGDSWDEAKVEISTSQQARLGIVKGIVWLAAILLVVITVSAVVSDKQETVSKIFVLASNVVSGVLGWGLGKNPAKK